MYFIEGINSVVTTPPAEADEVISTILTILDWSSSNCWQLEIKSPFSK